MSLLRKTGILYVKGSMNDELCIGKQYHMVHLGDLKDQGILAIHHTCGCIISNTSYLWLHWFGSLLKPNACVQW